MVMTHPVMTRVFTPIINHHNNEETIYIYSDNAFIATVGLR